MERNPYAMQIKHRYETSLKNKQSNGMELQRTIVTPVNQIKQLQQTTNFKVQPTYLDGLP